MKNAFILAAIILLAALAAAQDTPKVELFGGYSYLRVNPGFGADGVNTSGWEGSANFNLSQHWGVKADFSGHYCCDGEHLHTFMGGPQWSFRPGKSHTIFVHGLVGGAHASGGGADDTAVAWAAGGGWDWQFLEHVSYRVFQADYLGTHFLDETQHNFRVSTGLVFRFGKR